MKSKIAIFLIFLLAFILRFWQLGQNPPSLDWDEASLGYNAYSILKTGRDEYGTFLPLSIRSFGDYKPPLYTYLTTIPVAIWGLNEFSVRFVSAFFGFLTIVVAYYLIKELFPQKNPLFYLLFILFFAVSPWHIQFSRIAFEANLALFFFISGIYLFLVGLRHKKWLFISFASFAASMYAYHSPRLVVPALFAGLIIIFWSEIKKQKIWFLAGIILFSVLIFPLIQDLRTSTAARFGSVTLLNSDKRLGASIKAIEFDKSQGDFLGKLMHNRRIIYAKEVLGGYLDHFNFDFLFLTGDSPGRHHAAGMGMLYFWDLPFVVLGMLFLLKNRTRNVYLVFWWFAIAPLASSLTEGTPHAVRALMYLPTYQIFIAVGVLAFLSSFKANFRKKKIIAFAVFGLFLLNFFYYLHMYYVHTPKEYSSWWQYGYKELVAEVTKYGNGYDRIIVTYKYDQPYIYFLFYQKVDPVWYQDNWGKNDVVRAERFFGKYEFRNIDWVKDSSLTRTLLAGTPKEIPPNTTGILSEIHFLDGSVAFRVASR